MKNVKSFNQLFENNEIIKEIQRILQFTEEKSISTGELCLDSSPYYNEDELGIHLIEHFYLYGVDIVIYGGYKNEQVIEEYPRSYDILDKETLSEILFSLKEGIETDCLKINLKYLDNEYLEELIDKKDNILYEKNNDGQYYFYQLSEESKNIIKNRNPDFYREIQKKINVSKFKI